MGENPLVQISISVSEDNMAVIMSIPSECTQVELQDILDLLFSLAWRVDAFTAIHTLDMIIYYVFIYQRRSTCYTPIRLPSCLLFFPASI